MFYVEVHTYFLQMASVDEKYDTLLKLAPDPIFFVDAQSGEICEVSDRAAERLGYERERLVGMDVMALHPDGREEAYRNLFERTLDTGMVRTAELQDGSRIHLVTRDGDHIPVELHARPVRVGDDTWIYTIARDISTVTGYERQLEKQRNLLEVLNQVVRHDLRNDLQVVKTYTELLEDHVDEEGQAYLDTLDHCTTNAVEFTATARDLAEVIRTPTVETGAVPFGEILDEQLSEVRQTYPAASVELVGTIPSVEVVGNELLGSVFRNILQNAIKHNDTEEPRVTVTVDEHDETVEVCFVDNGPGVPDDQKETIFGKGQKGLESEGTGVGLYLARTLVDGYGGTIRIADAEPRGSEFVVELPTAE